MNQATKRKRKRIPLEHKLPCIYKATSRTTGESYIGQTVRGLHIRRRQHLVDTMNHEHECAFHQALRKLGEKDFVWEIVFAVENTKLSKKEILQILNEKERELVPYKEGLQGKAGGGNYVRQKVENLTPEQHQELKKLRHREVMAKRRKTCVQYQERQKAHRSNPDNKQKHRDMMRERSQTLEYKKSHRASVKKYQSKPEVKAKRKALYNTPEYIEKHRIAQRKYLAKKKAEKSLNNTKH